ncbi:unnamed protein product [Ceratitis capitata]|uniref:(Mediterranean fruit fly) hypothetical protein n=2 Tax=Ceratitis capitata TaxID=7213 RepID=A0A811V1U1_CERCA|nr:unnamed protein product [Ceratitis capitata]
MELPFISVNENPYWDIFSTLQAVWLAPSILLSYISYLCIIFTTISFGILLMKDLQFKLGNMNEKNDLEAYEYIKNCVKQHVMIIKYHRQMEVLFSLGSCAEVCNFCIIPCVIIVYSTMDYDLAFLMTDIQLAVIAVSSTFFNFWLANNFCVESLNIAYAAYNSNWIDRNKEFRKYIVLIMTMSQKPLQLTAAGLKPINMEFFLAILRAAYSLFTVLQ